MEADLLDPVLEKPDGTIFYKAVVVESQTYRIRDCVQIRIEEEGNGADACKTNHAEIASYDYGQITAIFEDPSEEDREFGVKLEIRWFLKPEDVRLVKSKKIKILPNELIESCKYDDIPPGAIMKTIRVTDVSSESSGEGHTSYHPVSKRPRHDSSFSLKKQEEGGEEDHPCRFLLSLQEDTLLPINVCTMWQRSTQHSLLATIYDEDKAGQDESSLAEGAARDPFSKAVAQLHISVLPEALPCREEEQKKVLQFLKTAMSEGGRKRPLYISGMPGTGKTATVHAAIKALQKEQLQQKATGSASPLPSFEFIEINGLRISSPQEAYTVLWRGLSGEYVGAQLALGRLKRYFENLAARTNAPSDMQKSPSQPTNYIVCLLDELDYLVTRNESIVYNFFDWPQQHHSGLIVIGIANTMDLPERLNKRSLSRLGGQALMRIAFKAYTHDQINDILADRLQYLDGVFDKKSLQLTARKAASTAGDLRSALKICQRAIELHRDNQLALLKNQPSSELRKEFTPVTLAMVTRAAAEYKENPLMIATGAACNLDKAIFIGMCRCHNSTGVEEMTVEEIWNRTCDVIHDYGKVAEGGGLDSTPPWARFDRALNRLVQQGMLSVVAGGGRQGGSRVFTYSASTMLAPRLPHNDITAALKDAKDPMAAAVWGVSK